MLDPAVARILPLLQRPGPKLYELTPDEARQAYRALRSQREPPAVAEVFERELAGPGGSIRVRSYRDRTDSTLPGVAYIHGGGWVIGDLDTHDGICRRLARESGCAIVSIDYRLAPEHPFPAALCDVEAALQWLHAEAHQLGIDPGRIALAGDSAGGNLAAAMTLALREKGRPQPRCQLLFYPVTDADLTRPSYVENGEGYFLETETMRWFWEQYVPASAARRDPLASPLRADDLTDLPEALVITAGFDPLRDEGDAYAEALRAAGVKTELRRYPGLIHGFLSFWEFVPEADAALVHAGQWLRTALYA